MQNAIMKLQNHDLAMRMAELARVTALRKVDDVLADVTATAKELIPGVDFAGVLLIGKAGSFETLAPTNELMTMHLVTYMEFDDRGQIKGMRVYSDLGDVPSAHAVGVG